jgi:hypothetical protein
MRATSRVGDLLVHDAPGAWPCSAGRAVPAAAKTIPRVARSRSADGVDDGGIVPAGFSKVGGRTALPPAGRATWAPIRSEPVALTRATRGSFQQGSGGIREDELMHGGRGPGLGDGLVEQGGAGQRGEWGEVGRLPDDRFPADQRDGGVPGPDRGREVECGDDRDHAPGCQVSISR